MSLARENILSRLKEAQNRRGEIETEVPNFSSPIYHSLNESLIHEFRKNLELIGGKVITCKTEKDIPSIIKSICEEKKQKKVFCKDKNIQELLKPEIEVRSDEHDFMDISIGITSCEFLVAHLGSVLISSAQISGRRLNVFPETHIIVAQQAQITNYLDDAIEKLQNKYKNELPSLISNITGPSRTADIEKTLVMGMHGPKSLIVVISEEPIKN